jgi:hypothetical protein
MYTAHLAGRGFTMIPKREKQDEAFPLNNIQVTRELKYFCIYNNGSCRGSG